MHIYTIRILDKYLTISFIPVCRNNTDIFKLLNCVKNNFFHTVFILSRLIRVEVCVVWSHKATFATRPFSDLLCVLEFLYSASSPIYLTNYGILLAGISSMSLGSIKILTKRRDLIWAKATHKYVRGHTCSYVAYPTNKAFNWRARITRLFDGFRRISSAVDFLWSI
jgi:hypothetical protein